VAAPGNFNYSRAVREHAFVQHTLLHLSEFRKRLGDRGLPTLSMFDLAPWETLDREDLLSPIAYALHGFAWQHEVEAHLDAGDLLVREEVGFRAWQELRDLAAERHDADLWVLYHPWQVLRYRNVTAQLAATAPFGQLGGGLESFYEARQRYAAAPADPPRAELVERAAADRALELLLVRVDNGLLPLETGRWHAGPILGLTEDAYEWTREQARRVDWQALTADCGVDADGLAGLYEQLTFEGRRIDPNERLFELVDAIRRNRRERFKGAALLAQDLYLAARLVRRWHAQLGREVLPDVDDVGQIGANWKINYYGTDKLRGNRAALPAILDAYGLYPYRVQLIGEGASEIAMLREILDVRYGLTFEQLGIIPTDIGGADVPVDAERLLTAMRVFANYYLLVFDNEGRARDLVDELERRGVVEGVSDEQRRRFLSEAMRTIDEHATPAERLGQLRQARERAQRLDEEPGQAPEFFLWRENLEADNFMNAELCAVVTTEAASQGLSWELSDEDLERALADEGDARGVASVLVDLAGRQDPPLEIGKPQLARLLARYAVEHPEHEGDQRQVLQLAEHLVRLANADRMLIGRLRER
jgi:hypothetical protein